MRAVAYETVSRASHSRDAGRPATLSPILNGEECVHRIMDMRLVQYWNHHTPFIKSSLAKSILANSNHTTTPLWSFYKKRFCPLR